MFTLSPEQEGVVERPLSSRIFLTGPVGAGKTTTAVARLLRLLDSGLPGNSILLMVPQRTLAQSYLDALQDVPAGSLVTPATLGGLARRMVDLFWPSVASSAGFTSPDKPPIFLTLETAQFYMAFLVQPLLEQGYFNSITIDRNRIYSQVIDNLNKAAVVGFPVEEIGARLKSSWDGEPGRTRVYDDAQACASLFRKYCLEHNLLDFSLQVEVFRQYLWNLPLCRDYLIRTYRHLIVDNIEEDVPVTHDLVRSWLPECDSVLVVNDEEAGYRRFLGANPESAYSLSDLCDETLIFDRSFASSPAIQSLGLFLGNNLSEKKIVPHRLSKAKITPDEVLAALEYDFSRFYPGMLDWMTQRIAQLVLDEGASPGEIVVLSPFLSDALRFSITHRLQTLGIPARSHRPSRSLREEPVTECLLTLTHLSHPGWLQGDSPHQLSTARLAYALVQSIEGLDLVRAQVLSEAVYKIKDGLPTLARFDIVPTAVQERITYLLGERYENLRQWIDTYRQEPSQELDHFLSRIFGEVLSQPGFGFHTDLSAGEITANLIESVQKFRWAVSNSLTGSNLPLGSLYLRMVADGVIAAQYIRSWQISPEEAVLLAPAYTFLMANRPVDYQFWLDVGARSWSERLYQPLTHPYVLSRGWLPERLWTDADESIYNRQALYRLATGLLRRCRRKLFLGLSDLGEAGFEQRGPLIQAFQRTLRDLQGLAP